MCLAVLLGIDPCADHLLSDRLNINDNKFQFFSGIEEVLARLPVIGRPVGQRLENWKEDK